MKRTKELLYSYKDNRDKLEDLYRELNSLDDIVGCGVSGIDYSRSTGGGSSGINDMVANVVELKAAKEKKINREIKRLTLILSNIEFILEQLAPRDRELLKLHYFKGYTLSEVGDIIGLTHSGTISAHKRCLKQAKYMLDTLKDVDDFLLNAIQVI